MYFSFHRRNRAGETEKEAKTVTFDESRQQQVEETPLMFSRCSSLGSLSSFDTQSVHSSVVSEYSRRASQVVSPSELPDSPSETMPPSPTRLQSPPARAFKADPGDGPVPSQAPPVRSFKADTVAPGSEGISAQSSPLKTGKVGSKVRSDEGVLDGWRGGMPGGDGGWVLGGGVGG